MKPRRRISSGLFLSVGLHIVVLAGFVSVADLTPSPATFDVFAADPMDTTPAPAQRQSLPDPPRPPASASRPSRPSPQRAPAARSAVSRLPSAPSADVPVKIASRQDSPTIAMPQEETRAASAGAFASMEPTADPARAVAPVGPVQPVPVLLPAPESKVAESAAPEPRIVESAAPEPRVAEPAAPEAKTAEAAAAVPPGQSASAPPSISNPIVAQAANVQSPSAGSDQPPANAQPPRIRAETAPVVAPPARPSVTSQTAGPRRPSAPHGSSGLGLGLGALKIRLDGASTRTTERETDVISGTLVGSQPDRVIVQIEGRTATPVLAGRAFATAVKLSPGMNRVRVVATDTEGAQVEETVAIEYKAPGTSTIAITAPRDGDKLAPDEPPLLTVQGEVSDPTIGSVWLVVNGKRISAPVTAGRFRQVVPVLEPVMRVRAETDVDTRSAQVTIDASAVLPAIGLLLGESAAEGTEPKVTVIWRPNPSTLEGAVQQVPMRAVTDGARSSDFFYLRKAQPGVYTFVLTYRGNVPPTSRPVLYLAGVPRSLPSVVPDGSGRAVIAKVLLPHGVLWEQEEWFTGRSASGDTVTKFRFPDGVSWTEPAGSVGR